ncbi:aldo/keto reductase [Paracoccus sp. DK608]|uniref:Aldo/keto reductase n=2 Tax=Paracoccus shanxieyensis TaxID=2675752 RepID=A0A6L6IZB0_9RHOB|nr:aldo/keto reductase [Paracoccus shanxieyensis]MTH63934.1 aldo/keto reductase [Paracoccus shanxieyensis]MTH87025.1 aldo/keto reductase [Paracoccus shanxieyensis]
MIPALPLGTDVPDLPALGLGCMGMSEFYGDTDDTQSLSVLARAYDLGVRMFDTADMYGNGHNEELLARFLKQGRPDAVIATKFGIRKAAGEYARSIDNSPDYIRQACDASLRRLGGEQIGLYYVHRAETGRPIEDTMQVLAGLVQAGKIARIGLSEVSAATLRRAHAVHPVAAVQSEYSLTTRDMEADILPACRELGTAFVAYSPLGRGLLSGTLDRESLAPNDFRRNAPRFGAEALQANTARLDTLRSIADLREATPSQVALAWVLAMGVFAIPGTKRLSYLEQNIAAASLKLSADDIARLNQAYAPGSFTGERYTAEGMKGVNG